MVLDNKDFKKHLQEVNKELYENVASSALLYRTKAHISRLMYEGHFFHLRGVVTIMRDLYQVEQDFLDSLDDNI